VDTSGQLGWWWGGIEKWRGEGEEQEGDRWNHRPPVSSAVTGLDAVLVGGPSEGPACAHPEISGGICSARGSWCKFIIKKYFWLATD